MHYADKNKDVVIRLLVRSVLLNRTTWADHGRNWGFVIPSKEIKRTSQGLWRDWVYALGEYYDFEPPPSKDKLDVFLEIMRPCIPVDATPTAEQKDIIPLWDDTTAQQESHFRQRMQHVLDAIEADMLALWDTPDEAVLVNQKRYDYVADSIQEIFELTRVAQYGHGLACILPQGVLNTLLTRDRAFTTMNLVKGEHRIFPACSPALLEIAVGLWDPESQVLSTFAAAVETAQNVLATA